MLAGKFVSVNGLINVMVRKRQIIEGKRKAACILATCGKLEGLQKPKDGSACEKMYLRPEQTSTSH